jgi:hypothetical protein
MGKDDAVFNGNLLLYSRLVRPCFIKQVVELERKTGEVGEAMALPIAPVVLNRLPIYAFVFRQRGS